MRREVTPELLDELPADDRRAAGSRRDLQKVNGWMGHARIMAAVLRRSFAERPPRTLVELGAGDGTLLLRIAGLLAPEWSEVSAVLVDKRRLLSAETAARFAALGWRAEAVERDAFEWLERPQAEPSDVCLANLFLHHFKEDDLSRLLRRAAEQTAFFLACEPERERFSLGAASLLWFIGCNEVSRHDAKISVRAGFAGRELSKLWPGGPEWRLTERKAGWFTHCFVAQEGPAAQAGWAADTRRAEAGVGGGSGRHA